MTRNCERGHKATATTTTKYSERERMVCARLRNGNRRCEDELSPSFKLRGGVSTWCYGKGACAWAHTMHSNKAVIRDVRRSIDFWFQLRRPHVNRDKCGQNKHPRWRHTAVDGEINSSTRLLVRIKHADKKCTLYPLSLSGSFLSLPLVPGIIPSRL